MTPRRAFWLVFAVALGIRVLFVLPMPVDDLKTPISSDFTVDAHAYTDIARALTEHGVFGYGERPTAFRPLLYPAFLAAVFATVGENFLVVRLLQALIGALACGAMFGLGARLDGVRTGVFAGLLLSVYPFVLYFTGEVMTETLFLALVVGSVYATVRLAQEPGLANALWAGAGWGLATLCRPMALGFIGVVLAIGAIGLVWRPWRARAWMLVAGALAIALLVPWSVRNSLLFERPVFLTTYTGHNLYKGLPGRDNVTAVREVGYNKTIIENPDVAELPADEATLDERSMEVFVREMNADPGAWLGEKFRDVRRLWFDFNLGGNLAGIAGVAVVGSVGAYVAVLLLALAGTGMGIARGRWLLLAVPWAMIVVTSIMYFPFFSGKRFRIPTIDPALILLASFALTALSTRLPRRVQRWLPDDGAPTDR